MADYEFIGKERLSRGFSYPLKRSTLDAYLDEHDIKSVTAIGYCRPGHDQRLVLTAYYYGPRRQGQEQTLTLLIHAVPSSIRQYVSTQFEDTWLGKLANWMAQFADHSQLVSQTDHRVEVHYDDVEDDGMCHLELRLDVFQKPHRI